MDSSVFVKYDSVEERVKAVRQMIGARRVWEQRMQEIIAQRQEK